jgi:hypothetical protein
MTKLSIAIIIFSSVVFVTKYQDAKQGAQLLLKDIGLIENE